MKSLAPPEITILREDVHRLLKLGDTGAALDRVQFFVDSIINNPRAVTRVLGSVELDDICQDIASSITSVDDQPAIVGSGTVIIASELSRAGGHEEVIRDLIALDLLEEPVSVLLTDCFGRADRSMASEFAEENRVSVKIAEGPDSGSRFDNVLKVLRDENPKKLLLFFHHQDAIGMCAALVAAISETVFIHHADHHISLGVTCKHFLHVDLSNMAFNNCRHHFGIGDNVYWPLVTRKNIKPRKRTAFKAGDWTSCSVGSPMKFMAGEYLFDYALMLPEILKTTNGVHLHIGAVPSPLRDALEESFQKAAVSFDRVHFISHVPSVAEALVEEQVDIFLGSFPIGGGKSTIEAMAAGIPLVMHKSYRHRLFCGADIAYPGALTWNDAAELFSTLAGLTPEILSEHSERARNWFDRHHSAAALTEAFSHSENIPPPLKPHRTNSLFGFLDEERALQDNLSSQLEQMKLEVDEAAADAKKIASMQTAALSERDARIRELEVIHARLVKKSNSLKGLAKLLFCYLKAKLDSNGVS